MNTLPDPTETQPQAQVPRPTPDPKRFEASRRVLLTDAFMNGFIKVGGIFVVVAVIGIFVFIVSQVLPMFQSARVEVEGGGVVSEVLPEGDYVAIAVDEWGERPLALHRNGRFFYSDLTDAGVVREAEFTFLENDDDISAVAAVPGSGVFAVGTVGGGIHLLDYAYEPVFHEGERSIEGNLTEAYRGEAGGPVRVLGFGQSESARLVAVLADTDDGPHLRVTLVERKRSLVGAGKWTESAVIDLTDSLRDGVAVRSLHVSNRTDAVLVVFENGEVDYHFRSGSETSFSLRQTFRPFSDLDDPSIAASGFLFGDVSMVFVSSSGANRVFSLYRTEEEPVRLFHRTKNFEALPEAAGFLAKSLRNKAFLTGSGDHVSLRHATTEKVRWEGDLPFQVRHALVGSKYDSLLFFSDERRFHRLPLRDPHPEVSFRALFGKVWYEGSPEPKYEWQSTGGSDDFEPKLSLVPLIFGTFKGTFYALLFALPIALFGAIYTSEFLHPRNKVYVKPVMEIMASLPSVVLGFLAALWLAPILENRFPSLLCIVFLLPAGSFLIGWLWSRQPQAIRKHVPPGREFLYFTPLLLLLLVVGWHLGPLLEQVLFRVKDSASGEWVGDFTRWWPAVTGTAYEQRNSLVVGFVMGFAVIPIIFTISEDALSNVP
ncbi:MAG: hypothetical protein GXX91_05300 [Verrucomicrobiaceae bacterium]|nr:hypothetical protein [Verrucomicrobiaceae bacterium]